MSVFGASVGNNSVIGSNSVLINDVPDHCIGVGSPDILTQQLNIESGRWIKLESVFR